MYNATFWKVGINPIKIKIEQINLKNSLAENTAASA